jgi:hypothetical protein
MSAILPAGDGERERLTIAGEHYYLIAVIEDGYPAIMVTVPDENKATGAERRRTAEAICERATAMIRRLMGGA